MNLTKATLTLAGAVALVGVGTLLTLQQRALAQLRAERSALLVVSNQVAGLRQENLRLAAAQVDAAELARLRSEHDELLRLRAELTRLRQELAATRPRQESHPEVVSAGAPAVPAAADQTAPGFMAIESFADVGFGTPEAAFQTLQWAMHRGQQERIQQGLLAPPGALTDGAQPAGMDMLFQSAGDAAGPMAAADGPGEESFVQALPELKGSRLLGRTDNGTEEVTLTVENEHADGTRLQVPMTFRKVGSE